MRTLKGYNLYIEHSQEYILHSIKARLIYIKLKFELLKELKSKDDFKEFNSYLKKQKKLILDLKHKHKHLLHYALNYVNDSKCSTKDKRLLKKRLQKLRILYKWTYSLSYFLLQQEKALKLEYEKKVLKKSNIRYFFNKLFKKTLYYQILKEESELYLTMKVFEHRRDHFFFYSSEMRKLERFSKIDKIVLKSAIFCNTLPIHGVGDILSLPFWGMYGIMQLYERTFKDYKDWKTTRKISLRRLFDELDKIESMF